MSLLEIIQDNRYWVLAVCLPLTVIYGRVLINAALGSSKTNTKTLTRPPTVPLRKMPPKPGSQPKPPSNTNLIKGPAQPTPPEGRQEVLPGSMGAGISSHQKAGSAKTVKMPVATPKPTDAPLPTADNTDAIGEEMEGLFGSRESNEPNIDSDLNTDKIPNETPTAAIRRKASRLQELGFHHSIPSDDVSESSKSGTKPSVAPASDAPTTQTTPGTPESSRSSTAELTSILERIDKFLAEDTPSTPVATLSDTKIATTTVMKATDQTSNDTTKALSQENKPSATDQNTPPAMRKTQPMWARPDVTDEDIKVEEPRKASLDDSAENETKTNDGKKTNGDQQRLF